MQKADWEHTRKVLRTLFITLGVGGAVWLLYSLQAIVLLLILAVFAAYLVAPIVEFVHKPFARRGLPRAVALSLVFFVLGGVAVLSLYTIVPRVLVQLGDLVASAPRHLDSMRARFDLYHGRMPLQLRGFFDDALTSGAVTLSSWVRESAASAVIGLRFAPWLILIPVITFFLLKDAQAFRRSALQMLPQGRTRWRGQDFFEEVNRTLAGFVRAQLIVCLFIAVAASALFALLGVPYAFVLGVLAGLLELLPLVGPLVVLLVVALVSMTVNIELMYAASVAFIALRGVNDYFVYPRLIGTTVGMHPLAVILALLCGGTLMGIPGMLLAIPMTAVASVGYRHAARSLSEHGWLAELLRVENEAPPAPALVPLPPSGPRLDGVRVLVVDNESDARDLLAHVLENIGAQVTTAGSAAEGLIAMRRTHPHVLLSDIGMPGEDGLDFIRQVRSLKASDGGATPAAALTGYATSEDRTRALHAGFQVHLSKPCEPAQLAHTVISLARQTAA